MDLNELAARAESAAPEEQRELLEALFAMINPPNVWHDGSGFAWRVEHFKALLDIGTDEAFTAAAMMLVPKALFLRLYCEGSQAILISPERGEVSRSGLCVKDSFAILAAICRSKETADADT